MNEKGGYEALMADIAAVFHWSLSELQSLELQALIEWHERAIKRLPQG